MCRPTTKPSGDQSALPADCRNETLGVAFFDLSQLREWASSEQDPCVASFLQRFYQLAGATLEPIGATLVKFMGDAGLVVFPEEATESAIFALTDFAAEARRLGRELGFDTYLNVNVHVGPVLMGSFGSKGSERFDVIGKAVNIAARLGKRGLVLSPQAFRCLSPEGRRRFEKITRPITYRLRS
jgi:class 3 adenylate cyclase